MKTLNARIFSSLLIIIFIPYLTGCKKDSNTTTLTVSVKCENTKLYSFQPLVSGADVYVFKDINFAVDFINGVNYDNLGNGKLKNKSTGAEISYFKKSTSNSLGEAKFEELPNGNYGAVVDILKFVKGTNLESWNGVSINLPSPLSNNTVKFVFDIWLYSITDLGL
jgi:hypothetical protein